MIKEYFKRNKAEYISVVILLAVTLLIMVLFYKMWDFNITVPITYEGGDETGTLINAKMFTEQTWVLSTDRLGAPYTAEYYDFTANVMHNFDMVTLKIFAMITGNAAVAFNLEFFSIFIFVALISYFVMRELKITNWIAICGSVTFAFSPFIIMRSTKHMVLSTCYFIPLSILLCIWLYERDDIFNFNRDFFKNKRNWFAILFIILIANNGIAYYQFFTCFLLLTTAISKIIKTRRFKYLAKSIAAIVGIIICMVINLIPVILYMSENGKNSEAVIRGGFIESEIYGLKLIQLLLPVDSHNVGWLGKTIDYYNNSTLFFNENITSYIGIMGICGFFLLLGIIFAKKKTELFNRLTILSEMNFMMLLLAAGSGIGTIFSLIVSDMIRGYNRISIFIAYVGILAFCLGLNALYRKYNKKWIFAVTVIFTLLCIWEQMPGGYVPDYDIVKAEYDCDDLFIKNIENSVSKNAMIYQLPYHKYPEEGSVNDMNDYHLFAGYLHSDTLKWSYGAMKGREADNWQENASNLPIEELVDYLKDSEFQGICIDRRAYTTDEIAELEDKLTQKLYTKPQYSNNNNLSFFAFK